MQPEVVNPFASMSSPAEEGRVEVRRQANATGDFATAKAIASSASRGARAPLLAAVNRAESLEL